MPRWFAHSLLVVGWLLTPVWAWAASHVGLWIGALVALRFTNPLTMLAIAGSAAFLFGFAVLWVWIRFMRHLPHLLSHRMAHREGIPEVTTAARVMAPSATPVTAGASAASRSSKEHAAIAAAD